MTRYYVRDSFVLGLLFALVACAGGGDINGDETTAESSRWEPAPGETCEPDQERECYDGPAETAGIGLCRAGVQTCTPAGIWGTCDEQVLPAAEDCNANGDEDCDGHACADLIWSTSAGNGGDTAQVLAVDSQDNVIVAGTFDDIINFSDAVLVAVGNRDVYVAKLTPSGAPIWTKSFGGSDQVWVSGLAIDSQDNIILSGELKGTVDFGGGPVIGASGVSDIYLAKLDADGNHVFSRYLTGRYSASGPVPPTGLKYPTQVVIGPADSIAIVGWYTGHWGGCYPCDPAPGMNAFVRVHDASGGFADKSLPSSASYISIGGAAFDTTGDLVVVGEFGEDANFGSGVTLSGPGQGAFVARLDGDLTAQWAIDLGDYAASHQEAQRVAVADNGDLLVGGWFRGDIDLHVTVHSDNTSGFVLRTTPNGVPIWSNVQTSFPTLSDQLEIQMLQEDSDGDVVAAGFFIDAALIGDMFWDSIDDQHGFVLKLDGTGNARWSKAFVAIPEFSIVGAGAVDSGNRIVVAGQYAGDIDLGNGPLFAQGNDVFVAAFQP